MSTNNKWQALSMRDRAFLIREAVRNGITDIDSIRDTWEHRFDGNRDIVDGGEIPSIVVTPDPKYTKFVNSLPDNQRDTPESEYYTHLGWKLNGKPEDFEEAKHRGMYHFDNSDQSYHGNSVAWDDKADIGYFLKPKHHETVKYELDWYNKGLETLEGGEQRPLTGKDREFWQDFKSKYKLDESGSDYKYIPRHHRFDGNQNHPTEDEYIAYKADSVRQVALNKARNRTKLQAPIIGYSTMSKYSLDATQKELEHINNTITKFQTQLNEDPENFYAKESLKSYQIRKKALEEQYKKDSIAYAHNVKIPEYGANCIYTVTGDYERPVSGNATFQQIHENKGFKKIPFAETLPGDLVQFKPSAGSIPNHALMANTPYNSDLSQMRYNGSAGGTTKESIRINARFPIRSESLAQAYRFVGNHADSLQWRNEYREKYPPKPVFDSISGVLNNPIPDILNSRVSIMPPNATKLDGHKFSGLRDIVNKVNTSDKDFARRLRQEGRASIPDWEDPRSIATHKLSVATDENGIHYIYPEVQNINGQLIDFTNPKIKWHGYGDGIAAERGDTIQIGNTSRDLRNAIKFTEKYKKLGIYPEFSKPPHTFDGESNQPTEGPVDQNEIKRRQAWAESRFRDDVTSKAGAKGRFQIMENVKMDYIKAGGEDGDLYDPEYNEKVRDWIYSNLTKRRWINKENSTDSVKTGKALAAYNAGPTNIINRLNRAKTNGIDIDTSFDWLTTEYMPEETVDYVNWVLRNKPTGIHRNDGVYNLNKHKYSKNKK